MGELEEGFFEVVVGFGGNIIVLEVFFLVESDGFGFYFVFFDIDFVVVENDGDVFVDMGKII